MDIRTKDVFFFIYRTFRSITNFAAPLFHAERMTVPLAQEIRRSHMDLIALDVIDRNPLAKKRKIPSRSYDLRSQLVFMKCRLQTKKPQSIRTVKRRFRMVWIQYALAKHLVAAAYTDDGRSLFVRLANLGGKSRFFEPTHVLRRILAARQQNQIGRTESRRFMHIA